jgi:hypothetical protein
LDRPARKHVKRVQTIFTEQQYELLKEHATEMDKPLSVLIREIVEQSLILDLEQRRKQKALEWMTDQELPADDWEVMERQIESRWEERWDE